jgi:hypothetical protein
VTSSVRLLLVVFLFFYLLRVLHVVLELIFTGGREVGVLSRGTGAIATLQGALSRHETILPSLHTIPSYILDHLCCAINPIFAMPVTCVSSAPSPPSAKKHSTDHLRSALCASQCFKRNTGVQKVPFEPFTTQSHIHNGQERYASSHPPFSVLFNTERIRLTQSQHSKVPHHRRAPHLHGLDRLLQDSGAPASTQTVEHAQV